MVIVELLRYFILVSCGGGDWCLNHLMRFAPRFSWRHHRRHINQILHYVKLILFLMPLRTSVVCFSCLLQDAGALRWLGFSSGVGVCLTVELLDRNQLLHRQLYVLLFGGGGGITHILVWVFQHGWLMLLREVHSLMTNSFYLHDDAASPPLLWDRGRSLLKLGLTSHKLFVELLVCYVWIFWDDTDQLILQILLHAVVEVLALSFELYGWQIVPDLSTWHSFLIIFNFQLISKSTSNKGITYPTDLRLALRISKAFSCSNW